MFNNLIESTSHAREYKRRGSFVLFTTGVYAVLLLLGGVASIYAYDAHLEAQTTQLDIIFVLPEAPAQPQRVIADPIRTTSPQRNASTVPLRIQPIDSPSNPNNVPDNIGTTRSLIPPAPPGARIGDHNEDPPPSLGGRGVGTGTGNSNIVTTTDPPPPPPPATPAPTPVKVLKISKILNSQALSLPRPTYPPLAKQIKVQGTVAVQVLIDESGKVISAKAMSGHPLLVPEAQKAAMQARFSPTLIGDQPVKVSGVITYNFLMN